MQHDKPDTPISGKDSIINYDHFSYETNEDELAVDYFKNEIRLIKFALILMVSLASLIAAAYLTP
ncbi:hypothetical protein [Paracoccus marcusii]|uniref:hypothetical protein n=1 Tax=Paracoccus marcusii TaxID=59779 RepID=UPI0024918EF4|nr:hypothetical protein [Paracoccus marcusii]